MAHVVRLLVPPPAAGNPSGDRCILGHGSRWRESVAGHWRAACWCDGAVGRSAQGNPRQRGAEAEAAQPAALKRSWLAPNSLAWYPNPSRTLRADFRLPRFRGLGPKFKYILSYDERKRQLVASGQNTPRLAAVVLCASIWAWATKGNMAKADEKGAGGFPYCMGCGRLFRCARFRLERSQVGNLFTDDGVRT